MSMLSPFGAGAMLAPSAAPLFWTFSPTASEPAHVIPHGAPASYLLVVNKILLVGDNVEFEEVVPRGEDASSPPPVSVPQTMAARQKALAGAYPDEYVVLAGDRVVVHTRDKEDAYARYDAALDEGGEVPIVIPPGTLRQTPPPVVRGRVFTGPSRGTGR